LGHLSAQTSIPDWGRKVALQMVAGVAHPLTKLWKSFVQPGRQEYSYYDLGPVNFVLNSNTSIKVRRDDITLVNKRGQQLHCSHWQQVFSPGAAAANRQLCVVYLHGMGSSRCDAWSILEPTLARGASLFALDFAGSGWSDGDYVSLGCHEESDVETAVDYLRSSGRADEVAFWGRSMGAATAIFRAEKDPSVAACVLDSPFSDFVELACEIANSSRVPVPKSLVKMLLRSVRAEVQKHAGFDLMNISPLKSAPASKVPAWFCTGSADDFVMPHHSTALHDAWGCTDRKITYLEGHHRSVRPQWFHERAMDFLLLKLRTAAQSPLRQQLRAAVQAARPLPAVVKDSSDSPDAAAGVVSCVDAADVQERSLRRSRASASAEESLRRTLRDASEAQLNAVESMSPTSKQRHILTQLLAFGVSDANASKAVARCSSMEASIDWLCGEGLM